jgi:ABC-2 type transport system ATP-binding protein
MASGIGNGNDPSRGNHQVPPMIEATHLTKRYGHTVAVDDLSFEVRPGRVTGFLGPNGAGKSTTMRMIMGLDLPTSGSVTVLGRPYQQHHRPMHEVGAVLDARAVHGGRSAYDHLLCLAQSNGISRRRVTQVLELVGLADVARRRTKGFSLGMSQRLGLAAALLGDPAVILCDEPVNGLDPEGIRWIRTLLRGLASEGRTVFVSSHLMSEMALTADHVIVVGKGRLLADTTVAELLAEAGSRVRVRSPQQQQLALLLRAHGAGVSESAGSAESPQDHLDVSDLDIAVIGDIAAAHQIALHELTELQPSLEAVFLELTGDSVEYRSPGSAA